MFKKILITLSTAFISMVMLTAPSKAVLIDTIALTGTSVEFRDYTGSVAADGTFEHDYHFNINDAFLVKFDIDSSFPAGSIADLTYTWINAASSLAAYVYTDGAGNEDPSQTPFFEAMTTAETWVLRVTGTFLSDASYSLQASVVPLPPAVIAFSTAMLGVGFLARRRRKQKAVV